MNGWPFVTAVLLVIFGIPAVMIACLWLWERRQLKNGVPTSRWLQAVKKAHKVTAACIPVSGIALAAFLTRTPNTTLGVRLHTPSGLLYALAGMLLASYAIGAAFAWFQFVLRGRKVSDA